MNTMSTGRTPGAPGWEGNGDQPGTKNRGSTTPKSKEYAMETAAYAQKNMKKDNISHDSQNKTRKNIQSKASSQINPPTQKKKIRSIR